jgi:hypothetical protein
MKPGIVKPCLHVQNVLHANVWLFLDICFETCFQADECKCNGWKTPIPPAKSPRVEVSQPLASFTDPCRSCTHVLGMKCTFIAIYLSCNCMLWFDSDMFGKHVPPLFSDCWYCLYSFLCQHNWFSSTCTLISYEITHKRKQIVGYFHISMSSIFQVHAVIWERVSEWVNLRPTVSRPVCPGVRRPSRTCDQFFFSLKFLLDIYRFVSL